STPPTSSRSESNPSPPHELRRDRLSHATLDGERLQVRETFLQSEPLLVEVFARTPEVERDLPSGFLVAIHDLEDLIETPTVVARQRLHAGHDGGERPPMRGQHLLWLERGHAAQSFQIVVQRVGSALRM